MLRRSAIKGEPRPMIARSERFAPDKMQGLDVINIYVRYSTHESQQRYRRPVSGKPDMPETKPDKSGDAIFIIRTRGIVGVTHAQIEGMRGRITIPICMMAA